MSEPQDPASQPPSGYGPPPGWDPGTGAVPPPAGQPAWGPPPVPGPGGQYQGGQYQGGQYQGGQYQGGQYQGGQYQGGQQTETKAVVALVLAIAAYTFVPFLAAIAALVLANMAKRDIAASGGRLTGQGLATAAFWLSVVHLAFVAVVFMGFALFVAVGGFGFS